jgi:hypothetical protein
MSYTDVLPCGGGRLAPLTSRRRTWTDSQYAAQVRSKHGTILMAVMYHAFQSKETITSSAGLSLAAIQHCCKHFFPSL